jgi:NAD(P)-dependent dehydrogenase (short-subunit alcohol dehydrogenase family)
LTARLGISGQDRVDEVVRARTAAAMADALAPRSAPAAPAPLAPAPVATVAAAAPAGLTGAPPKRFVMDLVPAAVRNVAEPAALFGSAIMIAGGDPALAEELAAELSARGAMPVVVAGTPELGDWVGKVDGLICLGAAQDGERVLPAAFPMVKSVLTRQPRWVIAVTQTTDGVPASAAGLRGFFRTLAREYPRTVCRSVEISGVEDVNAVAGLIVTELLTDADQAVVVLSPAGRHTYDMVPAALGGLASVGSGPAGVGASEAAAMGLTQDSVVLLVGGARGITAQFASALASASRCRIELAGRTSLPSTPDSAVVAAASTLAELRTALVSQGNTSPVAVDRAAKEILAQREVAATLDELRAHGSQAAYHTVDVRDAESIRQLVKQIHVEHGRIDAVVYAAGVIEDKLVADKAPDSFNRVFGTKVDGAVALLDELGDLAVRPVFTVFFGSIAATLGNRGQIDYSAANDALDTLGAEWSARTGNRALTVHWGPWAPTGDHGGMVSVELGRSYAERGIALINPSDGVNALLGELAWGPVDGHSVVYTASGW